MNIGLLDYLEGIYFDYLPNWKFGYLVSKLLDRKINSHLKDKETLRLLELLRSTTKNKVI